LGLFPAPPCNTFLIEDPWFFWLLKIAAPTALLQETERGFTPLIARLRKQLSTLMALLSNWMPLNWSLACSLLNLSCFMIYSLSGAKKGWLRAYTGVGRAEGSLLSNLVTKWIACREASARFSRGTILLKSHYLFLFRRSLASSYSKRFFLVRIL
jgi:hypothetical protein